MKNKITALFKYWFYYLKCSSLHNLSVSDFESNRLFTEPRERSRYAVMKTLYQHYNLSTCLGMERAAT
jgi:hypothetical protein